MFAVSVIREFGFGDIAMFNFDSTKNGWLRSSVANDCDHREGPFF